MPKKKSQSSCLLSENQIQPALGELQAVRRLSQSHVPDHVSFLRQTSVKRKLCCYRNGRYINLINGRGRMDERMYRKMDGLVGVFGGWIDG